MRSTRWAWGIATLAALSLVASVQTAGAQTGQMGKMGHEEKTMTAKSGSQTVQGEIVDMGCYMGHGARGQAHKSCALKCIAGGMPMGLVTDDGKLYVLTMSHEDADPFNQAKDLAAETVKITGPVYERDGILSLEVDSVEKVSKT